MFLGLGCGSSCGQTQTWRGIIWMPNGKKYKSLQLKLKSVVVEFRACFLLILKVRRSFPWPKSSMPFCSSAVSKSFPPNAAFCFNHQGEYIAAVRDFYLSVYFLKKKKTCK